ncbi:TetR/AcrR family transcriptional regulator [Litorimonas sp.]|uniref:TetR/AcrR family transcriptional regulator n=1 Tax=Litorimonas sp. TaxID=1892381 RepID=UPI003A8959A5
MSQKAEPLTGKAETIHRIIRAARWEFSENGITGSRMDNIAARAGVTKQLLYHYFDSKKNLFSAVLDERTDRIFSGLLGIDLDPEEPENAMRAFLNLMFDQYRDDPNLANIAQEAIAFHNETEAENSKFPDMAPALVSKIQPILKSGQEKGIFRADVDPRYFLAMASLIVSGGFTNTYMLSSILEFDTNSDEGLIKWRSYAVDFVIEAILNPLHTNA